MTKKEKVRTYRYEDHQGWGNKITIWEMPLKNDPERMRICGHLQRKPRVGDEITFRLKNGKTLITAVESVKYERNPRDMFWATLIGIQEIKTPQNETI